VRGRGGPRRRWRRRKRRWRWRRILSHHLIHVPATRVAVVRSAVCAALAVTLTEGANRQAAHLAVRRTRRQARWAFGRANQPQAVAVARQLARRARVWWVWWGRRPWRRRRRRRRWRRPRRRWRSRRRRRRWKRRWRRRRVLRHHLIDIPASRVAVVDVRCTAFAIALAHIANRQPTCLAVRRA
jgi:ribosomal protein L18